MLNGYKTYAVALGMVFYAILGLALGIMAPEEAGKLIFEAMGLAALRNGITNSK